VPVLSGASPVRCQAWPVLLLSWGELRFLLGA
jgi:hypothetical protein